MKQREPRQQSPSFLAFLRTKPCCACRRAPPSQAAHIRMASIEHAKRQTGKGEKPHDRWAVPLCQTCHLDGPDAQHRIGEKAFWTGLGLDPFAIAGALWIEFGAPEPAHRKRIKAPPKCKKRPSRPIPSRPTAWPKGRKLRSRSTFG